MKKTIICDIPMKKGLSKCVYASQDRSVPSSSEAVIFPINAFLSNLGPKILVKINLIGNVVSSVETKVRNYGINSALIEIYANIEVTEEVIIPFQKERIKDMCRKI